ncbi:hypothetical protein [Paraburkholderia strydomiana]|jgi:hypothetical protein|uniref:hypothetical protein n=1 Tax=Paraburkholderia strydomiana TaxID=1245417 RepID=UPI0038BC5B17
MIILARGERDARAAGRTGWGAGYLKLRAQLRCIFVEMHQNKDIKVFQDIERTNVVRWPVLQYQGCMLVGASIPRHRACSIDLRRLGAYMAQKLLYWCRSIWPGKFFCSFVAFEGGRAGTGQLDWAAAESAEFVNQEIGYE